MNGLCYECFVNVVYKYFIMQGGGGPVSEYICEMKIKRLLLHGQWICALCNCSLNVFCKVFYTNEFRIVFVMLHLVVSNVRMSRWINDA